MAVWAPCVIVSGAPGVKRWPLSCEPEVTDFPGVQPDTSELPNSMTSTSPPLWEPPLPPHPPEILRTPPPQARWPSSSPPRTQPAAPLGVVLPVGPCGLALRHSATVWPVAWPPVCCTPYGELRSTEKACSVHPRI